MHNESFLAVIGMLLKMSERDLPIASIYEGWNIVDCLFPFDKVDFRLPL